MVERASFALAMRNTSVRVAPTDRFNTIRGFGRIEEGGFATHGGGMLGLVIGLTFLIPATAACLYYLVPTCVGYLRGTYFPGIAPLNTFAILIPARDEE